MEANGLDPPYVSQSPEVTGMGPDGGLAGEYVVQLVSADAAGVIVVSPPGYNVSGSMSGVDEKESPVSSGGGVGESAGPPDESGGPY